LNQSRILTFHDPTASANIHYAEAKVIFAERFPKRSHFRKQISLFALGRLSSLSPSKHNPRQIMQKAVVAHTRRTGSKQGENEHEHRCRLRIIIKIHLARVARSDPCPSLFSGLFIRAYASSLRRI